MQLRLRELAVYVFWPRKCVVCYSLDMSNHKWVQYMYREVICVGVVNLSPGINFKMTFILTYLYESADFPSIHEQHRTLVHTA